MCFRYYLPENSRKYRKNRFCVQNPNVYYRVALSYFTLRVLNLKSSPRAARVIGSGVRERSAGIAMGDFFVFFLSFMDGLIFAGDIRERNE